MADAAFTYNVFGVVVGVCALLLSLEKKRTVTAFFLAPILYAIAAWLFVFSGYIPLAVACGVGVLHHIVRPSFERWLEKRMGEAKEEEKEKTS